MRSLVAVCLVLMMLVLAAAAWALFQASQVLEATRGVVLLAPALIEGEFARTRAEAVAEVRALRTDLKGEVGAARRDVFRRVDVLERLVNDHAGRIEGVAVAEIQATRAEVLDTVRPVAGEAQDLMAAYREVPAAVGARLDPWTQCAGNGACWQAQFTAVLGASRATLGQVARSAPSIAASMERSAVSTEQATAATAAAMNNLAELSRPIPRWLRVPLQVMGPTAPLWVPFLGR